MNGQITRISCDWYVTLSLSLSIESVNCKLSLFFTNPAIQCPEPQDVINATMTIEGVHYSHYVIYECITGYAANPNATLLSVPEDHVLIQNVTCSSNGTWDPEPQPCQSK